MTLQPCSCGHPPAEHLIAADSGGPQIYQCEAWVAPDRVCGCLQFSPQPACDPDVDEDLREAIEKWLDSQSM